MFVNGQVYYGRSHAASGPAVVIPKPRRVLQICDPTTGFTLDPVTKTFVPCDAKMEAQPVVGSCPSPVPRDAKVFDEMESAQRQDHDGARERPVPQCGHQMCKLQRLVCIHHALPELEAREALIRQLQARYAAIMRELAAIDQRIQELNQEDSDATLAPAVGSSSKIWQRGTFDACDKEVRHSLSSRLVPHNATPLCVPPAIWVWLGLGGGRQAARPGLATSSRRDPFSLLNRAAKPFTQSRADGDHANVCKAVMIILNRLAPSNFAKLSAEMLALPITNKLMLEEVCCAWSMPLCLCGCCCG